MKIAFVSTMTAAPWGGSEELWSGAALELAKGGTSVFASVPRWPRLPRALERLVEAGVTIDRRPFHERLALRALSRLTGTDPLGRLKGEKPDLVVLSQGFNYDGSAWMDACRNAGLRYAVIAQAAAEHFPPTADRMRACTEGYSAAAACYFVSVANRVLTEQQIGTPLPYAKIVRNPFQVRYDAPFSWPAGPTARFACVARLEPAYKGQGLLLEALAGPLWRERAWELTLFGEGAGETALRALARSLGLEPKVRFAGQISDIEAVWRDHHLLTLASRHEGLPLSLVEAMLCGRPAVVTRVGGNAEVVEDGVTGFIAEDASVPQVSAALERAWQVKDRWCQMGRRAAETIRKNVPRNPAVEFSRELLALASERGARE